MANVIEICGKRIPTEKTYSWKDFRGRPGVTCFFQASTCKHCGVQAFAYKKIGMWGEVDPVGGWYQADRLMREVFRSAVRKGEAVEIRQEDLNKKPTRGFPLVSSYTQQICRPVDQASYYLSRFRALQARPSAVSV